MVGTRPMRLPSTPAIGWRCGRVAARKAATLRTTSIFSMDETLSGRPFHGAEDVVRSGKAPCADIGRIARSRVLDLVAELCIAFHEARLELGEQAEDILG